MSQAIAEREAKIKPGHLERAVYVYVRQSSPRQVVEHLESRRRQYALVDWAIAHGWPRERIVMIDEDRGKSGATAKARGGFARLISAVARSEVGLVLALEVARLARNSPDWHHLIYLCRFSETLIADEHTVYDPECSSDRLLLGIRGQMGELELETSIERRVHGPPALPASEGQVRDLSETYAVDIERGKNLDPIGPSQRVSCRLGQTGNAPLTTAVHATMILAILPVLTAAIAK